MVRLAYFEVNNYSHIYIPPPFILLQTSVQPTATFSCTIEFFFNCPVNGFSQSFRRFCRASSLTGNHPLIRLSVCIYEVIYFNIHMCACM